jgi:hypothetical protein
MTVTSLKVQAAIVANEQPSVGRVHSSGHRLVTHYILIVTSPHTIIMIEGDRELYPKKTANYQCTAGAQLVHGSARTMVQPRRAVVSAITPAC